MNLCSNVGTRYVNKELTMNLEIGDTKKFGPTRGRVGFTARGKFFGQNRTIIFYRLKSTLSTRLH